MQTLLKGWVITGYVFFGVIAFFVFLYKTFPFGLLQDTAVRRFEAESGCRADVDQRTVHFPLLLTWSDIQIHCPNLPSLPIEAIQADILIQPLLFQPAKEIAFQIRMPANMGEVMGLLTVQNTPEGPHFSLNDEGENINLYPLGFMGTLNTQGSGKWKGQDLLGGVGSHTVTLSDLRIDFLEQTSSPAWKAVSAVAPLAGITALSFSTVRGEIAWQNHALSLHQFYAQGEIAEITSGNGTLTLNTPLVNSTLSMTFTVIPQGNLAQMVAFVVPNYAQQTPLTFVITGLLSSPQISMNGMPLLSML